MTLRPQPVSDHLGGVNPPPVRARKVAAMTGFTRPVGRGPPPSRSCPNRFTRFTGPRAHRVVRPTGALPLIR
jgi:hypothetical protein